MAGSGVSLSSPLPVGELSGSPAGGITQALFSALRASHFLLLRQKKVSKEKATPGSAPGYARSLALLGRPGGCGTRGCAPQTVLAESPRPACVAQRLSGGPERRPGSNGSARNGMLRSGRKNAQNRETLFGPGCFSGPLGRRRVTQALAEKGRGLSEGEARVPQPPPTASNAGDRAQPGADPGSPFLCLLSFGEAKESKTRLKRGKHKFRKAT